MNNISMSHESDLMREGRIIHENSFSRERKNIMLGNISVDFRKGGCEIIIFEIKKSRRMINAARWQLLFYLFYLKRGGINAVGVLTFPEERKRENVVLTEDVEDKFDEIFADIKKISKMKIPPKVNRKRYCRKCSYYDLCWV